MEYYFNRENVWNSSPELIEISYLITEKKIKGFDYNYSEEYKITIYFMKKNRETLYSLQMA